MPVTMKDVAKEAKVSLGSVSNYINGKKNMQPEIREKIEEAIAILGYEVNEVARHLKMRRSMTIGVIIPSFSNVFAVRTISYLERYFKEHGYAIHVVSCDSINGFLEETITQMIGKKVEGLVVMPSTAMGEHEIERINQLINEKVPVVVFDSIEEGIQCDHVVIDNYHAVKSAVEILFDRGHEQIALILGSEDIYSSAERLRGYKDAYIRAGKEVPGNLIAHTDYSKRRSKDVCTQLLEEHCEVTAILSAGYRITLGSLAAIREKGIRVPDDISVFGFDISEIYNVLPYLLNGVNIPTKAVARESLISSSAESTSDLKNPR